MNEGTLLIIGLACDIKPVLLASISPPTPPLGVHTHVLGQEAGRRATGTLIRGSEYLSKVRILLRIEVLNHTKEREEGQRGGGVGVEQPHTLAPTCINQVL